MAITLPKLGISYSPVPKNACTSIKQMFFHIENGFEFSPLVRYGRMFHIHNFYPSDRHAPLSEQDRKTVWKFAIVRDPIKRFVSSYSNRVVFHKELNKSALGEENIKLGARPDPDLEEFVERIEIYRKASWSIWHHTQPHTFFLGSEPGYFDRLFTIDQLSEMVSELQARVGSDLNLPHEQTGGPKIDASSLSANAVEKLQKFYQEDYEKYFPSSS